MQDVIWDATPSVRKKKEEQFLTPVITLSALDKIGAGRKFTFNKASQEVLNVQGEERVSFGFTADGHHIYIRKASGNAGFALTKTCSFSDKKTFEFIAKRLELNTEVENHFDVVNAPMEGNVFELVLRTPMTMMVEDFANAKEVVEFKSMDLGTISDESPVKSIIDEEVEETVETLDLTGQPETISDEGFDSVEETEEEEEDWN